VIKDVITYAKVKEGGYYVNAQFAFFA
jgi:hypothetical protein